MAYDPKFSAAAAAICFLASLGGAWSQGQERRERACCGQGQNASIGRSASPGAPGLDRLGALERAAAQRAAQTAPAITSEEYAALVKAATGYASAVAGDDNAQFTVLATSAILQAVLAKRGVLDTPQRSLAPLGAIPGAAGIAAEPERAIWELPALQENYRSLMEKASEPEAGLFPITGPPIVARIVGPGTQLVPADRFGDCVAVGRRIGGQDHYCCTGTLVGRNVVVTAGHCFFCSGAGASNTVVFIGNDINGEGDTYTGKIVRHPDYNQGGMAHDLAVIVLDSAVEGVAPRPIATTEQIERATFVRAAGFGNSDFASTVGFGVKRMVDVPVASISCAGEDDSGKYGCDRDHELVAGFVGLGPDSCNGDSGGPVYVLVGDDAREDSAWQLCGATSRATNSATRPCGDGGIYVRLDKYLDFIRNVPGAEF